MTNPFHQGELAVQARADVSTQAQNVGRIIAPNLPHDADRFLATLPILFQGGLDTQGNVWASPLTGNPGFVQAIDAQTVQIHANPVYTDPLHLSTIPDLPGAAGFLAIDMATRQRFRFNGDATRTNNTLRIKINQAYGNCPKYIQRREVTAHNEPQQPSPTTTDTALSQEDIDLIQRADTFFIATTSGATSAGTSGGGTDVSHRGGTPGFVSVTPQGELTFKDYPGNNMFQTLGNLTADPRAGLLFIDFQTGSTLQLSGQAEVQWTAQPSQDYDQTGRAVTFKPQLVVRTPQAIPLRWVFREYSPYNPDEKTS